MQQPLNPVGMIADNDCNPFDTAFDKFIDLPLDQRPAIDVHQTFRIVGGQRQQTFTLSCT
jgi:hypothetical protein